MNGKKSELDPANSTGPADPAEAEPETTETGKPGKLKKINSLQDLADNTAYQFIVGIVVFILGVLELLSPYDGIVIIGDLLPAAAGLLLGSILFINYFKSTSQVSSDLMDRLDEVLLKNKKYFGAAGMGIAILHIFFPQFVLL